VRNYVGFRKIVATVEWAVQFVEFSSAKEKAAAPKLRRLS